MNFLIRQTNFRKFSSSAAAVLVLLFLMIGLNTQYIPASAESTLDASLCGNGSSPDYGFSYNLRQPHWTVGWEGYTSEQSVAEVDTVLDELDYDRIAQTMILILPQEKVGNRVNCAVHFLRYMQLGLPEGERKDNGFVFLVVVEPDKIDVHYGVGLGLPALTASELTDLNRAAEETYKTTGSLDEALLTLVKDFDRVARANYAPLIIASPTPEALSLPTSEMGITTLCCLLCLVVIVIFLFVWILSRLARSGITFEPPSSGSWGGMRGPFGGSGGGGGGWSGGGSSSRGGSGSGRSGRGN
jgi:hypothetical protein